MRRAGLALALLIPLAACGSDAESLGQPPAPSPTECYYVVGGPSPTGPSTLAECLALNRAAAPGSSPSPSAGLVLCSGLSYGTAMPLTYGPQDCSTGGPVSVPPWCADVVGELELNRCLAAGSPRPAVSPASPTPPRVPTDTLESASDLLAWSGGEVTLVKGLSPREVLALMVPGPRPRPMREVCDAYGEPIAARTPQAVPTPTGTAAPYARTDVVRCLTARTVVGWTVVLGLNDLTVGLGPGGLLARLSANGREVVHVADHFEADAPFVVARDGREVRRFDFCSEGSADEGAPLPEEAGLVVDSCELERFVLVQRLTGVTVTQDLLTSGDRLAVVTSS